MHTKISVCTIVYPLQSCIKCYREKKKKKKKKKAIVYGQFYRKSTDKVAHAQSVCTRPFSPRWEGPGDEANDEYTDVILRACPP